MSQIIVEALAGTGKTTTIVNGARKLTGKQVTIKPSSQQSMIWQQLIKDEKPDTICFAAFNVSIKNEMASRMRNVPGCTVTTMHSMGYRTIRKERGLSGESCELNKYKTDKLIEIVNNGRSLHALRLENPGYVPAVKRLTQLSKYSVFKQPTDDNLLELAAHYDVNLGEYKDKIFDDTRKVMGLAIEKLDEVDFDDMVWLPNVLEMPIEDYDLLLVDEGQDLNVAQQELALKAGKRIALVGDSNQAIYGFAGADCESMTTMRGRLDSRRDGCVVLPLTITRRCSHAVVREAKRIVPEFEAHPENTMGSVEYGGVSNIKAGDMMLCRVNAPLLQYAFWFVGEGRPAEVVGKDIKNNITGLITMLKPDSVADLLRKLANYEEKEIARLERHVKYRSNALIAIHDKCACIKILCKHARSVTDVFLVLDKIFEDGNRNVIRLSSIHRAKGLEAQSVYIIMPELLPHPLAHGEWQMQQEKNLQYVAITRAIDKLTWVDFEVGEEMPFRGSEHGDSEE